MDARAGRDAELDRGRADAAGAAVDEQPLAGEQAACVKSASWAVVKTSGTPPAGGQSRRSGTAISVRSWTTASSAWPPPPTIPITRSPSAKRVAPGPSSATSPASSRPGMSAGEPGGAG